MSKQFTDFRIEGHGFSGTILIVLTDAGRALLQQFVHDDTIYWSNGSIQGIIIHHPNLIVAAIKEAGLTVSV